MSAIAESTKNSDSVAGKSDTPAKPTLQDFDQSALLCCFISNLLLCKILVSPAPATATAQPSKTDGMKQTGIDVVKGAGVGALGGATMGAVAGAILPNMDASDGAKAGAAMGALGGGVSGLMKGRKKIF